MFYRPKSNNSKGDYFCTVILTIANQVQRRARPTLRPSQRDEILSEAKNNFAPCTEPTQ